MIIFQADDAIKAGNLITIVRFGKPDWQGNKVAVVKKANHIDTVHGIALVDAEPMDFFGVAPYGNLEPDPQREQEVDNLIAAVAAVAQGDSTICAICSKPFDLLEQVGRCVYARPCNHRQYQGRLPRHA